MDPFNSPIQGYDGWNVNSSYLTPAYMANYRPQYGAGGRPNAFSDHMTVGQSIGRMGPMDHAFGRDVLQDSSYDRYNIATGAGDAAVWGLQNVAIPAAAWYTASSVMGSRLGGSSSIGGRMGAGMARGGSRMATGALGRGMGMMGMGGIARAGGGAAGALATGAGMAGGFAGSMFLPLMAAQAMSSGMDTMMIDPYVSTRRGMDSLMANTANTAITGGGASASGGFGMSATRAQGISQALTVAGSQDLMIGGGDYNEIADNMMRAGIFQEVGDMDQTRIVEGVKKATSVLKLIQRITGDPDIKNGIQTLATLKAGGLDDINQMGQAVNQLRNSSAVSGIGMQQMLDTIGNQGAVMAQQQGISANTGMLASSDAFAGFTNARRAGLISGTEAAMLGGVEGMTQNLMGGAYQVMNSGISRMIMQGSGQFGGSNTSNIGKWGTGVSSNPLASQGDWFLNQQAYKDKALNQVGASNIILKSLQGQARSMGLDPNDSEMLAAIAPSLGISPEQLRSAGLSDRAAQDPLSSMRMTEAIDKSNTSNRVSELQNHNQGLYGMGGVGRIQKGYNEMGQAFKLTGSTLISPVTEITSAISDGWTSTIASMKGIETLANRTNLIESGGKTSRVRFSGKEKSAIHTDKRLVKSDKFSGLFSKIDALLADPVLGDTARALKVAILEGDSAKASELMKVLDAEGTLSGDSTGGFQQQAFAETFLQDVERGAIGVEKVAELDIRSPGTTLKGQLAMAESLTADKRREKLSKIIDGKNGSRNMQVMYGISEKSLEGKSSAQRKAAILEKAMSGEMSYSDINTGSADGDESEFYRRFMDMGFSKDEVESYAKTRGGVSSLIDTDLQSSTLGSFLGLDDKTANTKRIAGEIQNNSAIDRKRESNSATDIDWSSIKDVTSGLSGLGQATDSNTNATIANTASNVALLNQNKRMGADEFTMDQFQTNPTENTVKTTKTDPTLVNSFKGG